MESLKFHTGIAINRNEGCIRHTLSASILSYSAWVPKNRIANTQPRLMSLDPDTLTDLGVGSKLRAILHL